MSEISKLQPALVWDMFDRITQVPRPSKKEEKIIAFLEEFAKDKGLKYKKDKTGNIVIYKQATSGREESPAVILQSHVDMVCEKNSDVTFDFDKDPIQTYVEDGWVRARGTTLGADCGIGMAAELAVLASDDVEHGPIEALFTVDEETGLTGAYGLADDMLTGKYLINLDSEDQGEIFIGCAGGKDTIAEFRYKREETPKSHVFFRVDVTGLSGGHSGDDIEKGRANSNKVLNRFLLYGAEEFGLRLAYFDGGNLRNAIPREAYAVFAVPTKSVKEMIEYFETYVSDISGEYQYTEKDLDITISEMPGADGVMDVKTQFSLLNALCGLPNGVLAMSRSMPGLVETSTNLASVKFAEKNTIVVTTSQRSSIESAKDEAVASVSSVFTLAGAEVRNSDGYPGWTPNPDSELLAIAKGAYSRLFGSDPAIKAIHAGLECGLFLQKYPWLEMISVGPTMRGVHSPQERLEVDSVGKFWDFLKETLKEIR